MKGLSRRTAGGAAVWACGLAVATAVLALSLNCGGATKRPNVLLLIMDTTRGDRCSVMGYDRPTTPRLDEFARDAVAFVDCWAPAGWTGPSHAALFTGLRCERNGFHGGNHLRLSDGIRTLAEILRDAGYTTACFTNNAFVSPEFGLVGGFTKFEPHYLKEDRPYPYAVETHARAAEWAEEQARAGLPFFLYVNDMEPHMPYSPPPEDEKQFVRGDPTPVELAIGRAFRFPLSARYSLGHDELTPRQLGILSDLYDAEVAALDREIGRLLDRLRATGLLDSTIVVIAGDHGEPLGDHHMLEHGYSLHRDARLVPLLVRLPGQYDGGRVVRSAVRLEDAMPTILELCGQPVPEGLDAVTLSRDLEGRVSWAMQRASGYLDRPDQGVELHDLKTNATIDAVYDGTYHYIEYGYGRRELYDVSKDPAEARDLANEEPAQVARLAALLRSSR